MGFYTNLYKLHLQTETCHIFRIAESPEMELSVATLKPLVFFSSLLPGGKLPVLNHSILHFTSFIHSTVSVSASSSVILINVGRQEKSSIDINSYFCLLLLTTDYRHTIYKPL